LKCPAGLKEITGSALFYKIGDGGIMENLTTQEIFDRLLKASGQSHSAKTVEVFGWLILTEGMVMLFAPHFVATVLHLPPLIEQAANYFRLIGVLVGGLGMLYIVSGRLREQKGQVLLFA